MTLLHQIGEALRNSLGAIPLGMARALFLLLLTGLLVWVLFLPAAETRPPNRPAKLTENLKVWAALALLIQILIYALL